MLGRGLGAYVALLLAGARPDAVRGAILFDGPGILGGGTGPGPSVVAAVDDSAPAPPDPFALAELSRDLGRPTTRRASFASRRKRRPRASDYGRVGQSPRLGRGRRAGAGRALVVVGRRPRELRTVLIPTGGGRCSREFKAFIMRGNVVDLAVAVVLGAAFGTVVTSLVKNIITPIIGIPGSTDFSQLHFTIHDSQFLYGEFLNSLISFVSIAAAVFFFVVKPLNVLAERRKRGEAAEEDTPAPTDEALILAEIRDLLRPAGALAERGCSAAPTSTAGWPRARRPPSAARPTTSSTRRTPASPA